jgi:hypothetical protein
MKSAGRVGVVIFEAANVPARHRKIEAESRGVQGDDDRQRFIERVRDEETGERETGREKKEFHRNPFGHECGGEDKRRNVCGLEERDVQSGGRTARAPDDARTYNIYNRRRPRQE